MYENFTKFMCAFTAVNRALIKIVASWLGDVGYISNRMSLIVLYLKSIPGSDILFPGIDL